MQVQQIVTIRISLLLLLAHFMLNFLLIADFISCSINYGLYG
jgi:hypothetical protein